MNKLYLLLLCCLPVFLLAQRKDKNSLVQIEGYVYESTYRQAMHLASVIVKSQNDSIVQNTTKTNTNGRFVLPIPKGDYTLTVSLLGYEKYGKKLSVSGAEGKLTLDTIYMVEVPFELQGVEIVAKLPPVQVKGDTIEFNAGAYSIDGSTRLRDLVKQIPGLQMDDNGSIKYGGKSITKILLDGKEYFGNDIAMALNTLPANMISKLQLFKKDSEEAKVSGIKDMDPDQVLNVEVKEEFKKSVFGDAKVGWGNKDRYTHQLNLNKMHGDNQYAFVGELNNINDAEYRYSYDFDDNVSKSAGINLNLQSSEKVTVNASGRYGRYMSYDNYRSDSYTSVLKQFNNRFGEGQNSRDDLVYYSNINWNPDSLTYISLVSNLSYDEGSGFHYSNDSSVIVDKSITTSQTWGSQNDHGVKTSNQLVVSRKTQKGRSLTLSFGQSYDFSNNRGSNFSEKNYRSIATLDTIDQRSETESLSRGYELSLRYVEPLTKHDRVYASYYWGTIRSKRDGDTRKIDPQTNEYTIIDSAYSRRTDSEVQKHDFRIGYQRSKKKYSANVNMTVSPTILKNKTYLGDSIMDGLTSTQRVTNFSPSMRLNYMFSESANLGISYFGTSRHPSISQLSADTIIISSMSKNTGNPDLTLSFTHRFAIDFYQSNYQSGRSFSANLNYSRTNDATVSATFVDENSNSVNTYRNASGVWDASAFFNFSSPLKNRNINVGSTLNAYSSQTISFINDERNVIKRNTLSLGVYCRFYSSLFESTLNANSTYGFATNNLADISFSKTQDYSIANTSKLNLKYNFSLESVLNLSYRLGYGEGVRKGEVLWNLSVSKLFLKDNRGNLKVQVFDVLNNFRTEENTVSGSDYNNYWRRVINHYFIASFAYRFELKNK